jgi:hypothetical protein
MAEARLGRHLIGAHNSGWTAVDTSGNRSLLPQLLARTR